MLTTIKRKRLIAKATQNAYYRRMTYEEVAQHAGIQACRRTLIKAFVLPRIHQYITAMERQNLGWKSGILMEDNASVHTSKFTRSWHAY
jgi:transposase